MSIKFKNSKTKTLHKTVAAFISFAFLINVIIPPNIVSAQSVLNLPIPGTAIPLSHAFSPAMIKGINVYPDNPLKFDFIVDRGDSALNDAEFKEESSKLVKYFLSSLTVPEEEMWVNLSPYEKNRIIPNNFGRTEMGRDLLAQDYMLKQLSSSLMNPKNEIGNKLWERIHVKALEEFGTMEIPMNTFNKIWIVPEKAVVYEHKHGAFVVDSHLKVMLEEDYLALEANENSSKHGLGNVDKENIEIISKAQSDIIREVLIPAIEVEVNEGETFANLRQIYSFLGI